MAFTGIANRKKKSRNQITNKMIGLAMWWCTPLIPVLGRQRQLDL